ncbi:unnamed protein product, partial [Staurois parvus]
GAPPKRGSSALRTAPPRSPLRIGTFGGRGERVPKFDRYPLPLPVQLPRPWAIGRCPPSLPVVFWDT